MTHPTLTLRKYHALGNDFLIAIDPAGHLDLGPATARRVCHRRRGVGADGLVHCVGVPPGADPAGVPAGGGVRFHFGLWNADGSPAETSGNGLRCAAHALAEAALVPGWGGDGAAEVALVTAAGVRTVHVRPGGEPGLAWATVAMGPVTVSGDGERGNLGRGQISVDVGNPHLVVLGPDPATVEVAGLGPALGSAVRGGRNVEFVALGPGPDEVTMRVWERGVGETEACGSGSCAAAAAVHYWGRVGSSVTVHQPGGTVEVELAADGSATLSGPSQWVATCQVPSDALVGVA